MNNRALHFFAVATACTTLALLGAGGLVTSHGVGMAVPDWPNTFGYNMFFFPVSQWVGGVFYEHTHRLLASAVGLLTTILALWLYGTRARTFLRWPGLVLAVLAAGIRLESPERWADALVLGIAGLVAMAASFVWPRCEPSRPWLRNLGTAAFLAVVLQGVLGGLRVVLFKDQIGILHATLAQLFFVVVCALALFTSLWWQQSSSALRARATDLKMPRWLPRLFFAATLLVLAQLILGATMRHQHAGLSIPDFPLAYGKLWPAMDPQSVAQYNQQRVEVLAANPITAFGIGLQMVHRVVALLICAAVAGCAWSARRELGGGHLLSKLGLVWLGLICVQALLGAATIWSNKAADIATLHVLVGALSLASGSIVSILAFRESVFAHRREQGPLPSTIQSSSAFGPRPSPAIGLK